VALRVDDGRRRLSLSANPDITLQLLPLLQASERPFLACAQINRQLPWMGNRAEVPEDLFDLVVDDPALDHAPFAVPLAPVGTADWAIGLRAGALVRDGGTLQVGIGALGDAACHALRLRRSANADYRQMLAALGGGPETDAIGGRDALPQGLYVASEMISFPLFCLFEDGIARRRVFEDAALQERVNLGLAEASEQRGGTVMQGAFFLGPAEFYRRLRALPEQRRALIDMTSVAEVNRVFTHYHLERLQRRHARFVNITMKATLLGAAVSDQLENGQVVSGVGGQHDFVSMAHQLPEGRSILLLRATRGEGRGLRSNIVWEFPHATIPRHLRDLIVTEYGVADLRGRTDRECIEAMLAVADSRFQEGLMRRAQRAGKLPADYRIPPPCRQNLPQRIADALAPFRKAGRLPDLPFGSDLSGEELALAARLRKLRQASAAWKGRASLLAALLRPAPRSDAAAAAALAHLQLASPQTPGQAWLARLVRAAFRL
jgi:acyl-CoA hydrolase